MVDIDIKKYLLESNIEEKTYIKTTYILNKLEPNYMHTKFRKLNISVYSIVQ